MQEALTNWLDLLSSAMTANMALAPLLALLAGVLASFMPCCLSTVPLVIAYVGGTSDRNPKRAFFLSVVFAAGMAVTFTILGSAASILGRLLQGAGSWWYILLGILMVLMALQTWGILNLIPSTYAVSKNTKQGVLGALLAGILGGFFSSPCSTPVLIVLLAVVAEKGSLAWGILLLLLYSIGHSTLVLIAGSSIGFVKKLSASKKYGTVSAVLNILMGAVILLIAFYMFYIGF